MKEAPAFGEAKLKRQNNKVLTFPIPSADIIWASFGFLDACLRSTRSFLTLELTLPMNLALASHEQGSSSWTWHVPRPYEAYANSPITTSFMRCLHELPSRASRMSYLCEHLAFPRGPQLTMPVGEYSFSESSSSESEVMVQSSHKTDMHGHGSRGKVLFVEKILRVQPNVKKLYLLVRAADHKSAIHRLHHEIVGKDLFRNLKKKCGTNFSSFISQKITVIPGDLTHQDLGLHDSDLLQLLCKELDVLLNLAATTNFDERYDVALGLNTLGAKYVVDFAKKCAKLQVLVHVSTAYVSGERSGLIVENSYRMGETLNGVSGLDVNIEKQVVEDQLHLLRLQGASDKDITIAMKDLGIQRARRYGWPNTYVFTKAMGEMMVGELKDIIPAVIIRPTIVTSTYKEPFPGWVEGIRTIDSLAVGYAKGKLTFFLGDLEAIVDVIPADMVVNAIIVAMIAEARHQEPQTIYQVGSSIRNPLRYSNLQDYGFRYFTKNPWINKDGKPVIVSKVTVMNSMDSFQRYMAFRYLLLLKGLELANAAFCHFFQGVYSNLNRKINWVMRLVDIYRPYLFFNATFDDLNTEKLRMTARTSLVENDMLYFDPKSIDWEDYFMNIHIPGIVKYIFK
ncbi:hypothetical protein PVK06_023402 [Gossypium arboreum]|uniref:Fatty acyl-CoA reductase n=1 Tax=Gossypium arboreum TaxID=29729 RepID=A0ABR0PB85_GOSAR|nr:hypothetical protein PVK06_023402 [Gossypium arboreum]